MTIEDVQAVTAQRDALQKKLEKETRARKAAEEKLAEAQKNVRGYVDELERIAKASATLVEQFEQQQAAGDRLRSRLAKVLAVYEALELFVAAQKALLGDDPALKEHERVYNQAKLALETPDG